MDTSKKILIVEDDAEVSKEILDLLERNGYRNAQALSGAESATMLEVVKAGRAYDLILLDISLPVETEKEIVSELKEGGDADTPVIVLTAVTDKTNVALLLNAELNDYITKPFDNSELLARIEARLKNDSPSELKPRTLRFRDITLDLETLHGFFKKESLGLNEKEFGILRMLMENPNNVFTRSALHRNVWNEEISGGDDTIDVHIRDIRAKISKFTDEGYVQSVWGIGFKMTVFD